MSANKNHSSQIADLINEIVNGDKLPNLNDTISELLQRDRAVTKNFITEMLASVIRDGKSHLKTSLKTLRDIREQERKQKAELQRVSYSFAWLLETSDPVPFLVEIKQYTKAADFYATIGVTAPSMDDLKSRTVPANWKPSQQVQQALKALNF